MRNENHRKGHFYIEDHFRRTFHPGTFFRGHFKKDILACIRIKVFSDRVRIIISIGLFYLVLHSYVHVYIITRKNVS